MAATSHSGHSARNSQSTSAARIAQTVMVTGCFTDRPGCSSGEAAALLLGLRSLVELAVLHDGEDPVLVLQDADVGDRIAVNQQQVGQVALPDLAELVAHSHELGAVLGAGED